MEQLRAGSLAPEFSLLPVVAHSASATCSANLGVEPLHFSGSGSVWVEQRFQISACGAPFRSLLSNLLIFNIEKENIWQHC